ncbi:MAG: DUF2759 family protein [Synergistaceae bacterium]|nr:DUF2759 family protein [Synergistaceae bacterium]MBQ3346416.1 DUF2759 family protein [Synergistaceae bacterium]MBQ3398005.1 DUF2759 family protein [Synergistaceae bacterium]MBQ3759611.1 DUF2759 family protein [Synergistaceae bacterium]MBQ6115496.1 DUF2759 family protein [Synergistaceae bacterium]
MIVILAIFGVFVEFRYENLLSIIFHNFAFSLNNS